MLVQIRYSGICWYLVDEVAVQVVDDVVVLVLPHHEDLVDDELLLGLLAQVHLLDGHFHAGRRLDRRVHGTRRTKEKKHN